jgi:hypothetical protein
MFIGMTRAQSVEESSHQRRNWHSLNRSSLPARGIPRLYTSSFLHLEGNMPRGRHKPKSFVPGGSSRPFQNRSMPGIALTIPFPNNKL